MTTLVTFDPSTPIRFRTSTGLTYPVDFTKSRRCQFMGCGPPSVVGRREPVGSPSFGGGRELRQCQEISERITWAQGFQGGRESAPAAYPLAPWNRSIIL